MSKQTSNKKYLEPSESSLQHLPDDLPPQKRIPRTLLISPTFPVAQHFYKNFLVKRKYCRNIPLQESCYDHRTGIIDNQILRVYPKMKYLQGIQIKSCLTSRYMNFYQIMCGIRNIKIEFEVDITASFDAPEYIRKLFKEFARLDLVKSKIEIISSTSFSISEMVANIIEGLKSMSNLKEFSFQTRRSLFMSETFRSKNFEDKSEKQISSKIPLQLKRLNKIEKLQIVFQHLEKPALEKLKVFTDDFSHLPNLKSIACLAIDLAHGKQIIDSLHKTQMLTSVTLYHFFEPDDILLLAMKLPNLKSVTIKDDWLITSQDMPSLSLVDSNGLNISQLNIELPLSIYSKEESDFVCSFLSAFGQIRSLSLSVESGGNEFALGHLCKQINMFSRLEQLKLGILVTDKGILSQFLSSINSLKDLKKISLTLKRESKQKWDCDIQEISNALKSFVQQSKALEELSINWDKFTDKCVESLKMILSEMKLNSFSLAYFPASQKHGKEHESVLKGIEGLFIKTTAEIKKVILVTQCSGCGDNTCPMRLWKLQDLVENSGNIKQFVPTANLWKAVMDDDHFI